MPVRWLGSSSSFGSGRRQVDVQIQERTHRLIHQSLATGRAFLTVELCDEAEDWTASAYPIDVREMGTRAAPITNFELGTSVPPNPFRLNGVLILIHPMDPSRNYYVRRFGGGSLVQTEVREGVVVVRGDPFEELRYLAQSQHARQAKW